MANVVEFVIRGTDKFSSPAGKIGKAMGGVVKVAAKTAAGVAAAGAAVLAFSKSMANAQDKVGKFADRIGVSVEQLSTMQFAAGQAGIQTDQFNMAVQRMTRRVAEAAQGTGEARGALVDLGIDAQHFAGLGLEDQMAVLADKMDNVGSESEKLRLAFKLFDSEGTAVIQMLNKGSEAMQQAAEDARFLGIVVGQQAAANSAKFNDEWDRSMKALKGVGLAIANEVIPPLTKMLKMFADFVAVNRDKVVNFVKSAIQGFLTFGIVVRQVFTQIGKFFDELFSPEGFDAFIDGAVDAFKWLGNVVVEIGPILIKTFLGMWKVVWEGFIEASKWAWSNVISIFSGEEVPSLGELLFRDIPAATAETREQIDALWVAVGERSAVAGEEMISRISEFLGINIEAAREQAQAWLEEFRIIADVTEQRQDQLRDKTRSYFAELKLLAKDLVQEQQTLTKELAKFTIKVIQDLSQKVGQAFAEVIVEGSNMAETFKNLLKSALKQVIATLIQIAIRRFILSKIISTTVGNEAGVEAGKAVGLTFANTMASMSAAPFPTNLSAPIVAAAHSKIATAGFTAGMSAGYGAGLAGARAEGGPVSVGRTFLVGERGPELFTPRANGNIIPNEGLGGGQMTIENLTISILPNATNADVLLEMSAADMEELVAAKIIPALDTLRRAGVKPVLDEEF